MPNEYRLQLAASFFMHLLGMPMILKPLPLYCLSAAICFDTCWTWSSNLTLSMGATAVFEMAAEIPPAKKSLAKDITSTGILDYFSESLELMQIRCPATEVTLRVYLKRPPAYRTALGKDTTRWQGCKDGGRLWRDEEGAKEGAKQGKRAAKVGRNTRLRFRGVWIEFCDVFLRFVYFLVWSIFYFIRKLKSAINTRLMFILSLQ